MLRSFHIENFKSLTDFTVGDLSQFTCLIGLNGSGKTALLQAIDFISHLASGTLDNWLKERDWTRSDLTSKLLDTPLINFRLEFGDDSRVIWEGCYDSNSGHCISEKLEILNSSHPIFQFENGNLRLWRNDPLVPDLDIYNFTLSGSILSMFGHSLLGYAAARQSLGFLEQTKSLELIAPSRMRLPSRAADDVGTSGETLTGFLHNLSIGQRAAIDADIRQFYPYIAHIETQSSPSGWAALWALEAFGNGSEESWKTLHTNAQHLNDGLLRVLTIVAQTKTNYQFLLFDEIENGMNPEKIGQLMRYLLEAKQQIMVTTHNPLILNFLPDDKAKESVFFLYRNRYGATKATRFFEIPEVAEKLEVLGPGEAFLDTSLEELVECIEAREVAA